MARANRDNENGIALRLNFLAALLCLPPNASERDRLAAAARVGMPARDIAVIFGKSSAAAQKALERLKAR